ncbi:MAG: hypothetical protein AAF436_11570, partial [Myxococcota bacterium]
GRSDEVGYSVAFGNVRGIKLGRQQRLRRLFNIWLPHISSMFILPLTMAYVFLRMAESLGEGLAAEVCTLFAYLLLTSGLLSLLAITNNVVTLIRRVRAGKMGFVDADPPGRPD